MARIRTIKPDFFTSLTIADLTPEQRLTFIGLWTHVDDLGRCVDEPRLIKAAVWPLDDRTALDVEDDLRVLQEASLIQRYRASGKAVIAVTNWKEHQKISKPSGTKLPGPDEADAPHVTSENTDSRNAPGGGQEEDGSVPRGKGKEGKGKEQGTEGKGTPAAEPSPPAEPDDPAPASGSLAGEVLFDAEGRETPKPKLDMTAFGAFYAVYPKKRDKAAAKKAWIAAVEGGADPDEITKAATAYARERAGQDPRFTKYPATWLNKGCWEDEPDPQPAPGAWPAATGHTPYRDPTDHSVYFEELRAS